MSQLSNAGLSQRTYDILTAAGIFTVSALTELSTEELVSIPGMSRKALNELQNYIQLQTGRKQPPQIIIDGPSPLQPVAEQLRDQWIKDPIYLSHFIALSTQYDIPVYELLLRIPKCIDSIYMSSIPVNTPTSLFQAVLDRLAVWCADVYNNTPHPGTYEGE